MINNIKKTIKGAKQGMRTSETYENGNFFQHFGKIVNEKIVSTNKRAHGASGDFLKNFHADVLICGGK